MGTALVALVAGAIGAGVTGLLQLRRDRVETLRQRQLEAADAFAGEAARVLLAVKLLLDSYPRDKSESNVQQWRESVRRTGDSLLEEVRDVAAHAPRIELLFGVKSPTSVAALQTVFDLTQMARGLRPPINDETSMWAYKLGANSALRFHDEAYLVIASSWWRRRRHKPVPDEVFEEMAAHFEDKYGITRDTED